MGCGGDLPQQRMSKKGRWVVHRPFRGNRSRLASGQRRVPPVTTFEPGADAEGDEHRIGPEGEGDVIGPARNRRFRSCWRNGTSCRPTGRRRPTSARTDHCAAPEPAARRIATSSTPSCRIRCVDKGIGIGEVGRERGERRSRRCGEAFIEPAPLPGDHRSCRPVPIRQVFVRSSMPPLATCSDTANAVLAMR